MIFAGEVFYEVNSRIITEYPNLDHKCDAIVKSSFYKADYQNWYENSICPEWAKNVKLMLKEWLENSDGTGYFWVGKEDELLKSLQKGK